MSYLDRLEDFIAKQEAERPRQLETTPTLEQIPYMRLSELAKRDIALQIYSELLGCEVWLCSNEEMASQIKQDDPEAFCYTVNEIRHLYKMQLSPDELRAMHGVKSVFDASRVIGSSLKGNNTGG